MTPEDWEAVRKLADERYRNWEWNYGRSPKSNIEHAVKFPSGIVDIRLFVEEGRIAACAIFGDFFGTGDVEEAEAALVGARYEEAALRDALAEIDVEKLLGGATREQFVDLLLLRI
jgi:lipoate-protein ligase A